MAISLRTAPNKVWNSTKPKIKKRKLKNKKLLLKDYANFANKFLVKKSKKYKLDKDLQNHHVLSLLANTDGQLIWKES